MRRPATGMFRSLRVGNYRLWAAGAFVSNIGTWVQRTAQTWLVLMQLTSHNASAVGLVMALVTAGILRRKPEASVPNTVSPEALAN